MSVIFKRVFPYQKDALSLPVANVDESSLYYVKFFGFIIKERSDVPLKSMTLERDSIRIGLAENGGDSTQDGCFFEVDSIEEMASELKESGLVFEPTYRIDKYGETSYKVFFVVAPDGLCFCFGERQN